jgi:hypothetical protein
MGRDIGLALAQHIEFYLVGKAAQHILRVPRQSLLSTDIAFLSVVCSICAYLADSEMLLWPAASSLPLTMRLMIVFVQYDEVFSITCKLQSPADHVCA